MVTISYYEILGISPTATVEQIREAYRRASKEHHPDKGGDPDVFHTVREAYETLINPEKRAAYDYFDGQSLDEVRAIVIQVFKEALHNSPDDLQTGISEAVGDIKNKILEEIRGVQDGIRQHEKILKRIRRAPSGMDFLGDDIRQVIQNLRDQKTELDRRLRVLNTAEKFLTDRYEFRTSEPWNAGVLNINLDWRWTL